jgi:hypothetical protein
VAPLPPGSKPSEKNGHASPVIGKIALQAPCLQLLPISVGQFLFMDTVSHFLHFPRRLLDSWLTFSPTWSLYLMSSQLIAD